ncbi:MAG: hypothetical protein FH756_06110 [Firmicutes bacterium]|nr:hypothetical protein [Bacillota bacterium]
MKLLSLTLKNFKGIRNFTLEPRGKNVDIYADNELGKTTLFDAFLWLLFGKDSQDKKDFDIKTLDKNNQPYHGLDHEVEAVFEIDGRQLKLCKRFSENWTQKRGTATKIFSGHTTDYFVDDVPCKEKDYKAQISEIADENVFKLLTNPMFFNTQFKWQDRRSLLLEVCGDISDQDVIASKKELAELTDILQGRDIEKHKKIIAEKRKKVNDELEKIPVRIDEVNQSMPDVSGVDPEEISQKITVHKQSIKEKEQQISRIESGGEVAEKTKELREIEGQMLELKSQHRSQFDAKIQEKQEELNQARERFYNSKGEIKSLERTLGSNKDSIENLESRMSTLRAKWNETDKQEFKFEQSDTCPTCGQALPKEKLEDARETALAHFNREKAEKLEKITSEGKELKALADNLEAENTGIERKIKDANEQLEKEENIVIGIQDEIEKMRQKAGQYAESEQYKKLLNIKEAIESDVANLKDGRQDGIKRIQNSITPLENEIRLLESKLADVEYSKQYQKRIEELSLKEKELAAEFEKLENELYLTDLFTKTKVDLLNEKINSRFKLARFKLFKEQINGGIEPCCETLYKGVPFSSMNNAARINVGLDIINTLSEHYGFTAPIFVDNAEAVTQLVEVQGQLIRLIVSEPDKELRIEYPEGENEQREAV